MSGWRDLVAFRAEVAAGFYAVDSAGGEWDVAQWDNANEPVDGNWEYKSQVRPPQPGEIHVVDNDPDPDLDGMFIHKTDNDGVDRTEALTEISFPPAFTLTDDDGTWATYNVTATRDMGDWFDYDITKAGGSELDLDQNSIVKVEWSTGDAVWGGSVRVWEPVECDVRVVTTVTGRSKHGGHYITGYMSTTLRNPEGRYTPGAPISESLNVDVGKAFRIVADLDGDTFAVFTGTIRRVIGGQGTPDAPEVTIEVVGVMHNLARTDRVALVNPGGVGELSGVRMHRVLDTAGITDALRIIGEGVETLQATDLGGNVLAEAYLVADSEGGELYGNTFGQVVFLDRAQTVARHLEPPAFTVAGYDNPDLPDPDRPWICYKSAIVDESIDRVTNWATIARVAGDPQVVIDQASIHKYGPGTFVRTDLMNDTDTWPVQLASDIVASRNTAAARFARVTLTKGDTAAAAAVLDAYLGSPIVATRRSGEWEYTETSLIQGITHRITPQRWTIDLALDPPFEQIVRSTST